MVNNVFRDFKSSYKMAGIKPVSKLTIHTLWKSYGQNWPGYLTMNEVKELMGHSKAETTLKYYSQVDQDHEKKGARVLQDMLERAKRSQETDAKRNFTPK
jgi:integrase